ncbi:MAG: sugar transferase, partial [Gemmatimonadota bacterium]|nr:sugar transferase [Gemmatimonadota bacterium]
LAAVAARWESGSPVLFRQQRVGRDGEPFQVLKFRTMTGDAPPYASSPPGDADPRITRTGAILRKTGLDELPQLINVIRGEMSIVGPRPEMPHLVQEYGPVERLRLSVKPGITGLWQLSADRHAEIHENIEYDLYYVHHQSLLLDLLILLETAFFTVGIVLGYFDRRSTRRSISHPAPMPGGSQDEYVLVALDQRWEDEIPANWRRYLPPLREISDQWPVRIVVAEDNRSTVDRMLRESTSDEESDVLQTTYAPYRSRDELRHLVAGARLVITDLEHVTKWTEEESVDALTAEEGGLRWSARSRVPDPIVSRLSELVTIFVGSEFTAVAERDRDPTVISITGTGT